MKFHSYIVEFLRIFIISESENELMAKFLKNLTFKQTVFYFVMIFCMAYDFLWLFFHFPFKHTSSFMPSFIPFFSSIAFDHSFFGCHFQRFQPFLVPLQETNVIVMHHCLPECLVAGLSVEWSTRADCCYGHPLTAGIDVTSLLRLPCSDHKAYNNWPPFNWVKHLPVSLPEQYCVHVCHWNFLFMFVLFLFIFCLFICIFFALFTCGLEEKERVIQEEIARKRRKKKCEGKRRRMQGRVFRNEEPKNKMRTRRKIRR